MGGERREGNAVKSALVVLGGLGLAWLTVETAFKPFLQSFRASIARSDPARDPDEPNDPLEPDDESNKDEEHKED